MVEVTSDPDPCPLSEKKDEYFTKFDIVCATCCSQSDLLRINSVCAQNGVKFFAGDVFGYYGYMFTDLGEHEYAEYVSIVLLLLIAFYAWVSLYSQLVNEI